MNGECSGKAGAHEVERVWFDEGGGTEETEKPVSQSRQRSQEGAEVVEVVGAGGLQ